MISVDLSRVVVMSYHMQYFTGESSERLPVLQKASQGTEASHHYYMQGNGLTRRTRYLVSKSLKEEILIVMCAALMNNTLMLKNRDVNFLNAVLTQLQFEVFQEADIIIRQNTSRDRMFFIEHRQFLVKTDFFQKELIEGDYFGDLPPDQRKRLATVRAMTICQLLSLHTDSFQQVLKAFPNVRKDLEMTAQ
ncbi:potassium/sodium hyperpolarization-activated cyclic nucleotide-gated channel 2-like [Salvelinus fontinalis]|uniref:potassium/sodium hyperpolarization-activated cyclic nucleotide-gated channel 2-like n=1 Tax=Salvelinus fontinalis TaxID=8038 RepID=UPI0024869D92|nr:potassium/sodium hyperpolarization-activated cyclic nucleotide-gated channel 2-like [Salvelinus fontinalis]